MTSRVAAGVPFVAGPGATTGARHVIWIDNRDGHVPLPTTLDRTDAGRRCASAPKEAKA